MSLSQNSKLTMKALEMAWETRAKPVGVMFHSEQAVIIQAVVPVVPAVTVGILGQVEHDSAWKLLR